MLATSVLALGEDPDHPAPTDRKPGATGIWFLLYAQAGRADGAGARNILLLRRRASQPDIHLPEGRARPVLAVWTMKEIGDPLGLLGLGARAGLNVLAVELLPPFGTEFEDPLAGDLGEVRILRASALVPVPARCLE